MAGEIGLGSLWRSLPAQLACDSDKTDQDKQWTLFLTKGVQQLIPSLLKIFYV